MNSRQISEHCHQIQGHLDDQHYFKYAQKEMDGQARQHTTILYMYHFLVISLLFAA